MTSEGAVITGSQYNQGVDPDEAAQKWVQDNGFDKAIGG